MDFYFENNTYTIHNTKQNCLTLQLSFTEDEDDACFEKKSLLESLEPSIINEVSSNEMIHVEIENPFSKNIKFHHKFIVKYLLHVIYTRPVSLKIICFDDELEFNNVLETLCDLLAKVDGTNIKVMKNSNTTRIIVGECVVYETRGLS